MQLPKIVYVALAFLVIGTIYDVTIGPHWPYEGNNGNKTIDLSPETMVELIGGYVDTKTGIYQNDTVAVINDKIVPKKVDQPAKDESNPKLTSEDNAPNSSILNSIFERKGISYSDLGDRIDVSKDMDAPTFKTDKDNTFVIPTESEFKELYTASWNSDFEAITNNGVVRSTIRTKFSGSKVPTIGMTKDLKVGYGLVKSDDAENLKLKCIKVTAGDNKEIKFEEAGSADNSKTAYTVDQKLE